MEYAIESAERKQFNKRPINTPFVLGAIIDLGNCLNLVEAASLKVLGASYKELRKTREIADGRMPANTGNNRALDCAVIQYIHKINKMRNDPPYDTVRC